MPDRSTGCLLPVVAILIAGGCPVGPGISLDVLSAPNSLSDQQLAVGASDFGVEPDFLSTSGDSVRLAGFSAALREQFPACGQPRQAQAWRVEIIQLVNQERGRFGLPPVTRNESLEMQASQYACELVQYEFFSHENPVTQSNLIDRAEEFEYEFVVIGENLAAGQESPAEAFADWVASPSHHQNILDARFIELGVGIAVGGAFGTYWVQEFGLPAP